MSIGAGEAKQRFEAAVQYLAENKNKLSFDQTQQLTLYGLFKQANHGPCTTSKPSIFNFADRAKWFPSLPYNRALCRSSPCILGRHGTTWAK
jgi:hypothetical protein